MSAQMITDSASDLVMRNCIQKVETRPEADAAMQCFLMAGYIHRVEGDVISWLKQAARIFCYHAAPSRTPTNHWKLQRLPYPEYLTPGRR